MARNAVIKIILGVVVALFTSMSMNARDLGQWDDPANIDLKRWYQELKHPDNPAVLSWLASKPVRQLRGF